MIEELGDILLQVLLHTSIGKKEGYIDIKEVITSLNAKMISDTHTYLVMPMLKPSMTKRNLV